MDNTGEEFSIGDVYVRKEDGTYVKVDPTKDTKFDDHPFYSVPEIDYNNFRMSIEMTMQATHIRGMFDVLAGKTWTPAASRWIRKGKRDKEKLRRKKLKER